MVGLNKLYRLYYAYEVKNTLEGEKIYEKNF